MLTTVRTACHEAFLEPLLGLGALVLPTELEDLSDPLGSALGPTLHASDFHAIGAELGRLGWFPVPNEEPSGGAWQGLGRRADGREVVMLACVDAVTEEPTLDELAELEAELRAVCQLAA